MNTIQPSVFDNDPEDLSPINRTELLPWWIRKCNWAFLLGGALVPVMFIQALTSDHFVVSAYGLTTNNIFSFQGFLLTFVFLFNAATAYSLLTERDWAIKVGIADALIGIGLCLYTMTTTPGSIWANFRFELIFLALFLRALMYLRADWDNTPA